MRAVLGGSPRSVAAREWRAGAVLGRDALDPLEVVAAWVAGIY